MRQQRTKPFAVWVTSLPLNALSPHVAPAATCAIASLIGADRKHHALPPSHACFHFFELSLYNVPYYAAAIIIVQCTVLRCCHCDRVNNTLASRTTTSQQHLQRHNSGRQAATSRVRTIIFAPKNNADGSGRTELQGISEEQPQCDVFPSQQLVASVSCHMSCNTCAQGGAIWDVIASGCVLKKGGVGGGRQSTCQARCSCSRLRAGRNTTRHKESSHKRRRISVRACHR